MTNTLELEILIKRAGFTKKEISEKLSLSNMGFYKKLNNITEFKASEIALLCELLSIDDKDAIFFVK